MAHSSLRAGFRSGWSGWGRRLCGLIVAGCAGWLAANGEAASTHALTYDAQGNPVTLVSSAATAAPVIVANPVGQLAQVGGSVTFSIVAMGTGPLAYQWRFNGANITTASNATANKPTLILPTLTNASFGNYSVVVSNAAGTATSLPGTLRLDSVGDGIPDSWKAANFGANWASNPNSAADADPDGDGFTNAEEYADGTNPNSATSHFERLTVYGNALVNPAAPRYAPGTVVTLTALPQGAQQFGSWTVQDLVANTTTTSTSNPLALTLNSNYAVTPVYETQPLAGTGNIPSFTVNNHSARAEYFFLQSNGKLLVGGTFDAVTGVAHSSLARFNADGTLDPTFNASFDNTIVSIAQQADGKLLVGGYFGNVNGVYRPYLARLYVTGALDTTFNPPSSINNFVRCIRLHSTDTRILVTGDFGGSTPNCSGVAVLSIDGSLDNTFATGTGANNVVWSAVWQSDGKVVLGGDFTSFNGTAASRLVRLGSTGAVDSTFVGTADNTVYALALRTDGDLIVGGAFANIDGGARRGIARLKAANGGFDGTVNKGAGLNNGNVGATGLVLQSDSKIVIGGSFSGVDGSTQANIARLNVDGSLDTSYAIGGTGVDNPVYGVGLDASGNTLIGGPFNFINGVAHLGIARLKNANGNLDAAYTVNASYVSLVYALAATPGGKVVAGGSFNVVNGIYRPFLARLNVDGSLDTPFNSGTGPNDFVSAIVVTPDGKTLVGGNFTTMNGVAVGRVARFNVGGMLDNTFNVPGYTDNQVDALAVQQDGKVVAGGYFQQFGGAQRLRLARLNGDGSLDGSFSPAFDNRVASVVIQPDAKILVGGAFANFNGAASGDMVRLNPDGMLDPGFTLESPNDQTTSIVLQPDGKILIGGVFTVLQGSNMLANRIARLNTDGTVDPAFHLGSGYGYDSYVDQVALQPDGKIVSVGGYGVASGLPAANGLPRLKADGSADTLLGAGPINNAVYAVTTLPDDSILIGGPFSKVDGQSRLAYARYAAQSSITPGFVTASPAGPNFTTGEKVTFSLTPKPAAGTAIGGVTFEVSADGLHFSTLGVANASATGAYSLSAALPAGNSYVRAAVTDSLADLAHSVAAGPFTTPPAVTGALAATGVVGYPFLFQAGATQPLTGYTATGLPAWATAVFDADAGVLDISGTPTASGTSTVALKPTDSAGAGGANLTITISSNTGAWMATNFSAAQRANPALSGPAGDATGAGIPNLLKYALGIPPHEPGLSARLPQVAVREDGGHSYLTLTYTRALAATDVVLTVQVSDDPSRAWNSGPGYTVEVSRTDHGDGTETVVMRDAVPVTDRERRFIRLQATQIIH